MKISIVYLVGTMSFLFFSIVVGDLGIGYNTEIPIPSPPSQKISNFGMIQKDVSIPTYEFSIEHSGLNLKMIPKGQYIPPLEPSNRRYDDLPHPPPLPSHIVKMLIPSPPLHKNLNFGMLEKDVSNPTSELTSKHSNLNFGMLPKGDRIPPSAPSNKSNNDPPPPPSSLSHIFKTLIPSPPLHKNLNFDILQKDMSNPTSGLTSKHFNLNFGMLPKGDRIPPSAPSNKSNIDPPPPPSSVSHIFKTLIPSPPLHKNLNFDMLQKDVYNPTPRLTSKHSDLNFGMLPKDYHIPPSTPSNRISDDLPPPPHSLPHSF